MDSKIIIIYGDNLVDGENKDGQVERLGKIIYNDLHIACFCDYFKTHFKDDETLQKINFNSTSEMIGYLLSLRSHLVFINSTTIKNGRNYGNQGFFLMPSNITEKQKEQLYKLNDELKSFSISIFYDLDFKDGFLDAKMIHSNESESYKEIIDKYFEITKKEKSI